MSRIFHCILLLFLSPFMLINGFWYHESVDADLPRPNGPVLQLREPLPRQISSRVRGSDDGGGGGGSSTADTSTLTRSATTTSTHNRQKSNDNAPIASARSATSSLMNAPNRSRATTSAFQRSYSMPNLHSHDYHRMLSVVVHGNYPGRRGTVAPQPSKPSARRNEFLTPHEVATMLLRNHRSKESLKPKHGARLRQSRLGKKPINDDYNPPILISASSNAFTEAFSGQKTKHINRQNFENFDAIMANRAKVAHGAKTISRSFSHDMVDLLKQDTGKRQENRPKTPMRKSSSQDTLASSSSSSSSKAWWCGGLKTSSSSTTMSKHRNNNESLSAKPVANIPSPSPPPKPQTVNHYEHFRTKQPRNRPTMGGDDFELKYNSKYYMQGSVRKGSSYAGMGHRSTYDPSQNQSIVGQKDSSGGALGLADRLAADLPKMPTRFVGKGKSQDV